MQLNLDLQLALLAIVASKVLVLAWYLYHQQHKLELRVAQLETALAHRAGYTVL